MNPEELTAAAEREVLSVLSRLPEPLREKASQLPVVYDARPPEALSEDGFDDLLGLFVGPSWDEGDDGLPPQILLFLQTIWLEVEEDEDEYLAEVRTTYLHELGHFLGLGEEDLDERGLL